MALDGVDARDRHRGGALHLLLQRLAGLANLAPADVLARILRGESPDMCGDWCVAGKPTPGNPAGVFPVCAGIFDSSLEHQPRLGRFRP